VKGPLLVIADNESIARLAPRWAEAFTAAGLHYRVRLVGSLGDRELEAILAEARSLAAGTILTAGQPATIALAAAAADRLGLPLVREEAVAGGGGYTPKVVAPYPRWTPSSCRPRDRCPPS
jgi:glycerol dehydrogenase-like iron-containing ADH family enzyme